MTDLFTSDEFTALMLVFIGGVSLAIVWFIPFSSKHGGRV